MNNDERVLLGKLLVNQILEKTELISLSEVEFQIFSQFGDDGIIQWIINNIDVDNKTFIEFGIENYKESNTKFLMINNHWKGFVMDGSEKNIVSLKKQNYYWRNELDAKAIFITRDNINGLLKEKNFNENLGLLHIDLDGNDFYILEAIECVNPNILILEYNSLFGIDREISVPYNCDFVRTDTHYSNLFYGASLKALYELAKKKGFSFLGCNSAGNNAYFVRNDKITDKIKVVTLNDGYVERTFRESRSKDGVLTFLDNIESLKLIKGMEVFNTSSKTLERL